MSAHTLNAIERILVMGAGPGGLAAAAALARRGFTVHLYNRSRERMVAVLEQGGVKIEGDLVGGDSAEELVPLALITTDIAAAMENIELILIAVPAYGQKPMLEACLALPEAPGRSSSCSPVRPVRWSWHRCCARPATAWMTSCWAKPSPCRNRRAWSGPASCASACRPTCVAPPSPAAIPSGCWSGLGDTLRLIPKPNVLDPGLNNPNFMIHPAPMLLNYAAVERQDGYLSIMNEGMTPGVLRLLDAVDEEKMALQRALGLDVVFIDDLYRQTGSGPHVYRVQGEPFNLRDRIWDRYITEDVPYGSVLYSSLGRLTRGADARQR